MKICFYLSNFQNNGGIGRVTSILANEFVKAGINVYCLCHMNDHDKPNIYNIDSRVNIHYLYNEQAPIHRVIFKGLIRKIIDFLKGNNIDLLIGCGSILSMPGIIAAKKSGIECFFWDHTSPYVTTDVKFQKITRQYCCRHSKKNVLLTKEAKDYYDKKVNPIKNTYIYNPIDENAYKSNKYNIDSKKIVSIGRFCYQKNFECLVNIASVVLKKHQNWTWDIYGIGPDEQKIKELIIENHLENNLFLKGQVNDIYDRLQNYSFIVMTSRYEGFPMTLLEASANRLPLLSFDIHTGPKEIIENGGNGYLIDFENKEEFIEKIDLLITNKELRQEMSDSSFDMCERFRLGTIIRKWNELFNKECK